MPSCHHHAVMLSCIMHYWCIGESPMATHSLIHAERDLAVIIKSQKCSRRIPVSHDGGRSLENNEYWRMHRHIYDRSSPKTDLQLHILVFLHLLPKMIGRGSRSTIYIWRLSLRSTSTIYIRRLAF
jgi:hypothetical protein